MELFPRADIMPVDPVKYTWIDQRRDGASPWAVCDTAVSLYDLTCECLDVNSTNKKLFVKKNNIQRILPTQAALQQYVSWSVLQAGHIWGQTLIPQSTIPPPTSWGWHQCEDASSEPVWTTLPEVSKPAIASGMQLQERL